MIILLPILSLVMGYLLGSINASIIMSKRRGKDIREMGSGNAGTTNTLRSLGAGAAAVTLTVDILKGVAAVLLARLIFRTPYADIFAGAGVVLGHNFPLYYGFRGGKGVLTSLAVAFVLQPWAALIALCVGIAVIAVSGYVSLGSMCGAVALPVAAAFLCREDVVIMAFMTCLAILVILRHHKNIERLLAGNERKLSIKRRD